MHFHTVRLGLGLGTLVLVALSACSGDDNSGGSGGASDHPGAGAAHAGSGGDTGSGDAIRDGGKGGSIIGGGTGGTARVLVDACGPYPIDDLCRDFPSACPSSPEDIVAKKLCVLALGPTTQYDTTCGGHVVEARFGTHTIVWGFDASGKLTYERYDNDVDSDCEDGRTSSSARKWGEVPCERIGGIEAFSCDGMGGAAGTGGTGGADTAGEAGGGGQGGATP